MRARSVTGGQWRTSPGRVAVAALLLGHAAEPAGAGRVERLSAERGAGARRRVLDDDRVHRHQRGLDHAGEPGPCRRGRAVAGRHAAATALPDHQGAAGPAPRGARPGGHRRRLRGAGRLPGLPGEPRRRAGPRVRGVAPCGRAGGSERRRRAGRAGVRHPVAPAHHRLPEAQRPQRLPVGRGRVRHPPPHRDPAAGHAHRRRGAAGLDRRGRGEQHPPGPRGAVRGGTRAEPGPRRAGARVHARARPGGGPGAGRRGRPHRDGAARRGRVGRGRVRPRLRAHDAGGDLVGGTGPGPGGRRADPGAVVGRLRPRRVRDRVRRADAARSGRGRCGHGVRTHRPAVLRPGDRGRGPRPGCAAPDLPGHPRRPDRSGQPGAAARAARRGHPPRRAGIGGRAVLRPRRVQAGQRLPRAQGG